MRHQLFRRKAPTGPKPGKTKSQPRGGDQYLRESGTPESKLSKYLSRLLDSNAAERR